MSDKPFRLSLLDIAAIRQAQRQINETLPLIQTLQDCGEDCSQYMAIVDELNRRANTLLANHGNKGVSLDDVQSALQQG